MPSDAERERLRERSRERVDGTVDELLGRYDDVEYVEFEVEDDPDRFESGYELVSQGLVGGAGAWIADEAGRVLMIRHPGDDHWGVPAGGHEPGVDATFEDTARREAFEEVGVEIAVEDLFRLHRKSFYRADDPRKRLYLAEAWFDARQVGGTLDLDPGRWDDDETIAEARWFSAPPANVVDVLGNRVERWDWPGG